MSATAAPDPSAAPDSARWTRNDSRIIGLIGSGHFLSHFYILTLPPLFLSWRDAFGVSYAELGLAAALMSAVTAALQTPVGFLVDRHGARAFLVGGNLLMALSIAAMGLATEYWQILVLAVLSGVGNSVIHPADYAIMAGSIGKRRMGRAFALHTFTGNLGFALAPPVVALLMLWLGWRGALLVVGLAGVPVVAAILWQSRVLRDQAKPRADQAGISGAQLLTSRTMLGFFAFFLLSAMAGAGIMTWLVTVLTKQGLSLPAASTALTAYMIGATGGVLVGGWLSDRTDRHLPLVIVLTLGAAALVVATGALPLGEAGAALVIFLAGLLLGTSRTPRDVMVKDAAPAGQVGKVFGFVSSGLPLGQAITPVPFGALIDWGFSPLVLPFAAALMVASLFFAGGARAAGPMRVGQGRVVAAE